METCTVEDHAQGAFEELVQAMSGDAYWYRFFARPCCPAPDAQGAEEMLDRLKGDVDAKDEFTSSQKDELKELIEGRKEWYKTCGLCRSSRS